MTFAKRSYGEAPGASRSAEPEPLKLFIGTGDGLRLEGYTTVDINPAQKPDIIANASALPMIADGAVAEIYASHVLEHIAWPDALSTLAEWARVLRTDGLLKISVPDMALLCQMVTDGKNPWHAMGNIFGGQWKGPGGPQGHYFGYTRQMLAEVLGVLGFVDLDHWNSALPEGANGWLYGENGERLGLSVNISGVKRTAPLVEVPALIEHFRTPATSWRISWRWCEARRSMPLIGCR